MPNTAPDDSPALPEFLREGALLAGKYRIGKPLGAGGMGLVLAAVHHTLGTKLALKVIHREGLRDAELPARFVREGRAAAQLQSEHVVRVHDLDVLPDGRPYLAMEFLDGADLGELLEVRPRLEPDEAVEIARQVCMALSEAHAAGIVHRDLKPQNLFLVKRSGKPVHVKVLDFGIAKFVGQELHPIGVATRSQVMMGSPVYMAPEQMRAAQGADARSDLWSLGVVLYQMLSGKAPFEAATLPELCAKVLTERAPPLDAAALGLPEGLDDVVMRLLEPNPGHRFESAEQVIEALGSYVATRPIELRDVEALASQRHLPTVAEPAAMPWQGSLLDPSATVTRIDSAEAPTEPPPPPPAAEAAAPATPARAASRAVRPTIADVLAAEHLASLQREHEVQLSRRRTWLATIAVAVGAIALGSWAWPQVEAARAAAAIGRETQGGAATSAVSPQGATEPQVGTAARGDERSRSAAGRRSRSAAGAHSTELEPASPAPSASAETAASTEGKPAAGPAASGEPSASAAPPLPPPSPGDHGGVWQ